MAVENELNSNDGSLTGKGEEEKKSSFKRRFDSESSVVKEWTREGEVL